MYGIRKREYFSENKLYIYEYILNSPGVHLRKICRELGLAMGDTQYHLSTLEKEGRIKSKIIGHHRHYYSVTILDEQKTMILAFLGQETTRDILVYLMENPGSTQKAIARFKNVSAPTIKWHMTRLIESTLVIAVRDGKAVRYFIRDSGNLTPTLMNYMPILWKSLANRFAEKFLEFSLEKIKTYADSTNCKPFIIIEDQH